MSDEWGSDQIEENRDEGGAQLIEIKICHAQLIAGSLVHGVDVPLSELEM